MAVASLCATGPVILRLAWRALLGALTFLLATAALYAAVRYLPGTPWSVQLESRQPHIDEMMARHHLDRGLLRGYLLWLGDTLSGNLGDSYSVAVGMNVSTLIEQAIPTSLLLGCLGVAIALAVALGSSFAAAIRPGGAWDRSCSAVLYLINSAPTFWIAISLQTIFALHLHLLPSSGSAPVSSHTGGMISLAAERIRYWILPPVCLALGTTAFLFRFARAGLLDALRGSYVRAGRARGLPRLALVMRHAFAESRIHLVTWLGLVVPSVIGGSIVIEKVFGLPGLGRLLIDAVAARDYPIVMGVGVVMIAASIAGSTAADLAYQIAEPRLRQPTDPA